MESTLQKSNTSAGVESFARILRISVKDLLKQSISVPFIRQ
jgi:hypothetical protein